MSDAFASKIVGDASTHTNVLGCVAGTQKKPLGRAAA